MIEGAAKTYGLPIVAVLAMLKAESGLDPDAVRYGVWPDVSGGFSQLTVETAARYGIGNGQNTQENIQAVLAMLCDRATAIDLGTRHLAAAFRVTEGQAIGDEAIIWALAYYNAGTYAFNPWYWSQYSQNVANYRGCLAWAHEQLGE